MSYLTPMENFNFIIIGAGRGGTSLLAAIIDSHSKLEVGFEYFANILIEKSEFYQSSKIAIFEQMKLFKEACVNEAKNHDKKLWGNKITTEQILGNRNPKLVSLEDRLYIINTFFKTLQNIKVIFILRDGRSCVRSKVNRTNQPTELACLRWQFSVEVYKYCLTSQNRNAITIKFEDLLTQPKFILEKICEFLAVDYEEHMLRGTMNPKLLPEYRNSSFDSSKLTFEGISNEYFSLIEKELHFCNYL